LEGIFDGFAPAPRGTKSRYGDFIEYTDYSLRGSAVRIGPSIYVVEASYGVDVLTGTFMVVARNRAGHLQALWNIKELAEKHYPQKDEIGRWMYLTRRTYYSGPLTVGRVSPVFSSSNGHARFLVDALQGADGGTQLAQLSIWDWDGANANPLLVEAYHYVAGNFGAFRFDGTTVRIPTKETLKVLFSCGGCPEPQGVWKVRITPSGVKDLGHQFLQPEFQWADELLSKIDGGDGAAGLADAKVSADLKEWISSAPTQAGDPVNPPGQAGFSWGMLGYLRVLRRGERGAFIVQTDDARLSLNYVIHDGRPYFTKVEIK
jgi:hypothetical protein